MPAQFEYSGVDRSGLPVKGLFEGENPMSVVLELKNAGVTVYSIKKKSTAEKSQLKVTRGVGAADLIAFNSQLATLLKTKLPLSDSLKHLSKELRSSRFKSALERITAEVESGRGLAESLSLQKAYFPALYVSIVEAGEKSGNLAETLLEASRYFQAIEDFRRKIQIISVYPAALAVLAVGVLIFLLKLLVPPYIAMYSGFHVDFPLSLQVLVRMEEFFSLNSFWTIFAPGCLAAFALLIFSARRNEAARLAMDRLILRIPFWGRMSMEIMLARSFATLSILLGNGVPLYESLNLVKNLVSNRSLRGAFEAGAQEVLEGQPFSQSLVKQPMFPLEVAWIVRNGEAGDDMVGSLDKAGRICQNKFDFSSQMILSTLEPALLLAVGLAIVAVGASLFYPLYSLSSHIGGW